MGLFHPTTYCWLTKKTAIAIAKWPFDVFLASCCDEGRKGVNFYVSASAPHAERLYRWALYQSSGWAGHLGQTANLAIKVMWKVLAGFKNIYFVLQAQIVDISTACKMRDPPHLQIAQHEAGNYQGWILADGKAMECSVGEGIFGMLMDLLSCYYAWNIDYPTAGFQILGFLQEIVIKDDQSYRSSNQLYDFLQ